MKQVTIVGLDLAKKVFQVHGVDACGTVLIRRALRRSKLLELFAKLPPCLIGMEACATAHHWARELGKLGHEARLIPPAYAKAYVRRNKNDAADAAAICEAVSRPTMRFVTVKTAAQQAASGVHKVRRNAAETAHYADQPPARHDGGIRHRGRRRTPPCRRAGGRSSPIRASSAYRRPCDSCLLAVVESLRGFEARIEAIDKQLLAWWPRQCETCRHLISIPGYGPIVASAMAAMVVNPGSACAVAASSPPRSGWCRVRTGTWWQGRSSGRCSKRGNGYLRRLLVNGAMAVLRSKRATQEPWLVELLATKPRLVAAVALANKMARIGWALMMRNEDFRTVPAAA